MFPIAILAGGLATRLRPVTETIPKALVEVAGKPFIFHQLKYIRDQGITDAVICIGYHGSMIRDAVGSGKDFDLKVSYSDDGPRLLGTGGALKKAIYLLGEKFFILYGDSYLPINFFSVQEYYEKCNKKALITILKNQNLWDKSNVIYRDGSLIEYNKRISRVGMNYIDYGLGIITASVLEDYPLDQSFELSDAYHKLSLQGNLAGFEIHERFYEIGSHAGLKETEEYFRNRERR